MDKNTVINDFIKNYVTLNKSRSDRMESGIEIVTKLLKENEPFRDLFIDVVKQGSFRHGTANRPVTKSDNFDLDLLFEMKFVQEWEPKDYLKHLHDFFYARERYRDIVDRRGKTRCVTLDYESDFHIDIVPCVDIRRQKMIPNKNDNAFEPTDGDGYAEWFTKQNTITHNALIKTVQLMKYLRDYKGTFTIKSIVFTTLLGSQVQDYDTQESYLNTTTALKTLLSRLDSYLQTRPIMPDIFNPVLPSEKFTQRHWTEENYKNFREKFHNYSRQIINAIDGDDENFVKEMQEIFGDNFLVKKSSAVGIISDEFSSRKEQFIEDLTNKIEDRGYKFKINCEVEQDGFRPFLLKGRQHNSLKKKRNLKFFIEENKITEPYTIKWKVKNKGKEAQILGQLRGEISDDNGLKSKKEKTAYEGEHYVECYAINENNICIARDRLDVPIGYL